MGRAGWMGRRASLVLLLAALMSIYACGKKASPRAPEAYAPAPVQFLSARGATDGIVLTWQPPKETASGEELVDLAGYAVKRSLYEKDEAPDFETIAEIPAEKSPADAGPAQTEVQYRDQSVKPGQQYEYIVRPYNADGVEGDPLNVVRVTFVGESSVIENIIMGVLPPR